MPIKGRCIYRKIVEKFIGRPLLSNECIHHKDRNRNNNDISNLQIVTHSEHVKIHLAEDGNPFQGKHHTEKFKKQKSELMKNKYVGKLNPFYGKKHSEENKRKWAMKQSLERGENSPNWRGGKVKIYCVICNKESLVYPCGKNVKTCGNKDCYSKYMSMKMREVNRNG